MDNLHQEWVVAGYNCLVRSEAQGQPICETKSPLEAYWIASRLNLAAKLEQLTYDYATGKTNGEDIVNFVLENINI